LGGIGFLLIKRNILNSDALDILSRLVVEVTLPLMIFSQLIKNFSFNQFPNWWVFPLMSLFISFFGFCVGVIFCLFLKEKAFRRQFISLNAFQNSGYLPLVLVSTILPKEKLEIMFIYLFLFLLGFNFIIWSMGVYFLTGKQSKNFALANFFTPPVIATILSLILVYLRLNRFIPNYIYKPLNMLGESTLALAMLVVGGNIAEVDLKKIDKTPILLLILVKLIILPLLGLLFIIKFRPDELIGLLLIIQLAVPSATSLSLIIRHYEKGDLIISQGVFWTHIISLLTLPLFLSLYFNFYMIK
jgi:predicted permease